MDIKEYYSEITDFNEINKKINEFNFAYKSNPSIRIVVDETNQLIDLDYVKESNGIENEKTAFKIVSWGNLFNNKESKIASLLLLQGNLKNFNFTSNVKIKVTTSPHVLALETILDRAKSDKSENIPLSDFVISDAHWDLLKNGPQEMWAGRYRNCPVRVSGVSDWLPPNCLKVPDLMEDLVRKYNEDWKNDHPIIKAAKFHCEMIHIHPFFDGNGRTARLITNYILVRNNFPIITIKKHNKQEYFNAVNDGIVNGNITGMVNIILSGLEQRYRQYVYKINESKNIANGVILNNKDIVVRLGKTIFYSENVDTRLFNIDAIQDKKQEELTMIKYELLKKSYLNEKTTLAKDDTFSNNAKILKLTDADTNQYNVSNELKSNNTNNDITILQKPKK